MKSFHWNKIIPKSIPKFSNSVSYRVFSSMQNHSNGIESFHWNKIIPMEWIKTKPTHHPGSPSFVLWKSLNLKTFAKIWILLYIQQKSHLHIAVKNWKYPHFWDFFSSMQNFWMQSFHWNKIITKSIQNFSNSVSYRVFSSMQNHSIGIKSFQ